MPLFEEQKGVFLLRRGCFRYEKESFEFSNDTKTFAEMLIFYLNIRNEKASNFYRAVNIDRRLFSKILNNDYHSLQTLRIASGPAVIMLHAYCYH